LRFLIILCTIALLGAADIATGGNVGSSLVILAPYFVLLVSSRRSTRGLWLGALAFLVAGTVFGLQSASSSSTGGLAFVWLLPLQLVVAIALWPLSERRDFGKEAS
jgi:hypothetical protein